MSQVLNVGSWLPLSLFRSCTNFSSIRIPHQDVSCWWSERPDSINDAAFAVQMAVPTLRQP